MKSAVRSGIVILAVIASACLALAEQSVASKAEPEAKAMKEEQVQFVNFRFNSLDCERRFHAIRAYFAEKASGPSWHHEPIQKFGNFLEESWCFPSAPHCSSNCAKDKRGTLWYGVSTLFYEAYWPEVFGLNVSAGRNARNGEWGIQFFYSVQGEGIIGSGLNVDFIRFDGESPRTRVHLGTKFEYQAEATPIQVSAPGDPDAELRLLYASEDSFTETALARYGALQAEVEKAFKEHRVRKHVYGPYKGGGIPPMHKDIPLSAYEEKAAFEKACQDLASTRQTIEQDHKVFYQLLVDLIPYDRCWK